MFLSFLLWGSNPTFKIKFKLNFGTAQGQVSRDWWLSDGSGSTLDKRAASL